MKAKFIGDPREPGEANNPPETMEAFGVTFPRGKFVEVPRDVEHKFEGNSHFETQEGRASSASRSSLAADDDDGKETVAELAERIAGVDDVAALKAELKDETRVTARSALEHRIDELEA